LPNCPIDPREEYIAGHRESCQRHGKHGRRQLFSTSAQAPCEGQRRQDGLSRKSQPRDVPSFALVALGDLAGGASRSVQRDA